MDIDDKPVQPEADQNQQSHGPQTDSSTDAPEVKPPQTDAHLSKEFVREVENVVRDGDTDALFDLFEHLHAADVADILEFLTSNKRIKLIQMLGERLDPDVLAEIEGEAQDEIYENIPNEQLADAVTELETDDAVYVLEELDDEDREEVLRALATDDRIAIEESLSYPEDSAGRLMQRELVALPEFWTVGQTIDHLRSEEADVPEDFYDVFIVDPTHTPIGTVPLSRIMRTARDKTIGEIMDREPYTVNVEADQEEVAYQFTKYHLISAAVVDESKRLVGVVTVDDVVDVIEEEAGEDILALAGVGETGLNESFSEIVKSRFAWLLVNLGTAILASVIIGLFEATIEQLVALAVLMPVVASMGGNAGTQTMTVAVRALATRELSNLNAFRVLRREFYVALANGLVLSAISGAIAWLWFDSMLLGSVFALAMIFNLLVAGLFGLLIPLTLNRFNIDPAIASSVFVTTITDVFGFFAFLGMAAIWL